MTRFSFNTFLERRESPYYAAAYRVVFSLFLLLNMFLIRNSLLDLYGKTGMMNWDAGNRLLFKYNIPIRTVAGWTSRYGFSADETIILIFTCFTVVTVFLLLGLFTQVTSVVAWILSFITIYAGRGSSYGMHGFIHISLFYLILFPSNRVLALDAVMFKRIKGEQVRSFTRVLFQLHIAIMYFSSGYEKALGIQWWNGEAIWRALSAGPYMQYDVTWMAHSPFVPMAMGIGAMVVEMGYIVFMWIPKVRTVWLVLTILLHVFIAIFMGLHMFALIMIILNLGAFGPEAYKDLRGRRNEIGG